MKMQYHHAGKQFFFITVAIEGRWRGGYAGKGRGRCPRTPDDGPDPLPMAPEPLPGALSRLVDEKSRPALLPRGEAVKAALCALHGAFPCATVSDFVIMPDHVHFLLIVDYARAPGFSPLWATHRLLDATEMLWGKDGGSAPEPPTLPPNPRQRTAPGMDGGAAPEPPKEAPNPRQSAAPGKDGGAAPEPLNAAAAAALAAAVALARQQHGRLTIANTERGLVGPVSFQQWGAIGGSGAEPPSLPRWDRRCYIEISFDAAQLKAIRHYIRLNPARALWKARHPDRFIRYSGIRHAILDPSRHWDGMGNLTLLGSPFLYHVRLTMRKTAEEHAAEIADIVANAERGMVPVCGFISPGEKELLRRLKASPVARFVKTVPFALPPRYDPSAEDSRELAADRMLILSGFPQGTPDSRENLRERCNLMNDLAEALCKRAREGA